MRRIPASERAMCQRKGAAHSFVRTFPLESCITQTRLEAKQGSRKQHELKNKAELRISITELSSLEREINEISWSPLRCKPECYFLWGFCRFPSLP